MDEKKHAALLTSLQLHYKWMKKVSLVTFI